MYDAIGSVNGRGVTLEQARELLPPINGTSVVSAIHRLSIAGALTLQRRGKTIIYCATPGAHPTDKRGRPRIAATPRSGTSGWVICQPDTRRIHAPAGECAGAVALARDPYRLHATPDRELVTAAAVLAKGLVSVIDGGGLRAQRASALDLLDSAGRAIGNELRRRQ